MKRFYVKQITKNFFLEIDLFKSFVSLNWLPLFNHCFDLKLKGSHRGIYWSLYLLGFKIFEINIYDKRHQSPDVKYDPIIDY